MGFFGAAHGWGMWGEGGKKAPSAKSVISYNDETWYSYTFLKEDPKNI